MKIRRGALSFLHNLVLAGKVLVHEFLLACAMKRHERPAAPGAVYGVGLRKLSVFAVMIAEFHD